MDRPFLRYAFKLSAAGYWQKRERKRKMTPQAKSQQVSKGTGEFKWVMQF
jgi:hypothetical protein